MVTAAISVVMPSKIGAKVHQHQHQLILHQRIHQELMEHVKETPMLPTHHFVVEWIGLVDQTKIMSTSRYTNFWPEFYGRRKLGWTYFESKRGKVTWFLGRMWPKKDMGLLLGWRYSMPQARSAWWCWHGLRCLLPKDGHQWTKSNTLWLWWFCHSLSINLFDRR